MKHIPFPSINQFRQVVKNIRSSAEYHQQKYPAVVFEGSVKLHGTNGGIVAPLFGSKTDVYFQSRERLCTIESDNAAFAFNQTGNLDLWAKIIDSISVYATTMRTGDPALESKVQIFGEWAGGNIQKGVGISGLPKFFSIFGIRVSPDAESTDWFSRAEYEKIFNAVLLAEMNANGIYTKYQFPTYYLMINFAKPEEAQNSLVALTDAVEQQCPVAAQFKPDSTGDLVGEGIVWTPVQNTDIGFDVSGNMFKTKGERHSASKVKTIAAVDVEKMESVDKFVEYAVTENRLNQGLEKMKEMNVEVDPKNTGQFIKWIMGDVIKEESDVMRESNLTPKDVTSKIASEARRFWLNQ